MVHNNQKIVFNAVLGYLSTPIWTQKGTRMMEVGGMHGPMSKLEKKPLTKSIGPFL
jgi:hypothetical protein